MCKIIPELDGNVSDHLPLRMLFTLDVNIPIKAAKIAQDEFLARPLWGDTERKNRYRDILERKLENVTLVEIDKQADLITKQTLLDSHDKNISNAMHQAAKEAGCYPEKRFKPKAFPKGNSGGDYGQPVVSPGGGPRVVVSTAAFHARVRGSVPGLGGLKETKNVSSPSTCESQYCGESPWPRGSVLGLRPPGLEFRILCLEDSVISIISPSSGGSPGPI